LYELTKIDPKTKKDVPFVWTEECQKAFDKLKVALLTAPVMAYPQREGQFIVDCDASDVAIGGALSQIQDGQERVIHFASFVLTPAQRKYCTTRKELLAVVRFTREFRHYLLGRQFVVRTDHNSLVWLTRFKNIEGQLARWIEELSQYDLVIQHRAGVQHSNADGLSRIPITTETCYCYEAGKELESLPCGGCAFCRKLHTQWSRFESDVDDVVPLAIRSITTDPDPETEGTEEEGEPVSNYMQVYTPKELREEQLKDVDLRRKGPNRSRDVFARASD